MKHLALMVVAIALFSGCGQSDGPPVGDEFDTGNTVIPDYGNQVEQVDPTLTQPTGDSALSQSETVEAIQSELEELPEAQGSSSIPMPIIGKGIEPFWTLSIDQNWISFERHGLPIVDEPYNGANDTESGEVLISTDMITVVLDPRGCPLDLGGGTFTHSTIVRFEDTDYEGCSVVGDTHSEQTATSDYSWSALIPETLGAIDSCLSKSPEGTVVNAIYPRDENLYGLILTQPDGRQEECGAPADGSMIAFLDAIEPGTAELWMESGTVFVRGSELPDRCKNVDADEVASADGRLGYVLTDTCELR